MGNRTFLQLIDLIGGEITFTGRRSMIKSGLVRKGYFVKEIAEILQAYLPTAPSLHTVIGWSHIGGNANLVAPNATAFYYRDAEYIVAVQPVWETPDQEQAAIQWVENLFQDLAPYVYGGYLNYMDENLTNWRELYYGSNYKRLKAIKKRVDPKNFWKFPRSIGS
jgi:FAD/FMN-containing dehydrogenase